MEIIFETREGAFVMINTSMIEGINEGFTTTENGELFTGTVAELIRRHPLTYNDYHDVHMAMGTYIDIKSNLKMYPLRRRIMGIDYKSSGGDIEHLKAHPKPFFYWYTKAIQDARTYLLYNVEEMERKYAEIHEDSK